MYLDNDDRFIYILITFIILFDSMLMNGEASFKLLYQLFIRHRIPGSDGHLPNWQPVKPLTEIDPGISPSISLRTLVL